MEEEAFFTLALIVGVILLLVFWAASFEAGQNALLRDQCAEQGLQWANQGSEVLCFGDTR